MGECRLLWVSAVRTGGGRAPPWGGGELGRGGAQGGRGPRTSAGGEGRAERYRHRGSGWGPRRAWGGSWAWRRNASGPAGGQRRPALGRGARGGGRGRAGRPNRRRDRACIIPRSQNSGMAGRSGRAVGADRGTGRCSWRSRGARRRLNACRRGRGGRTAGGLAVWAGVRARPLPRHLRGGGRKGERPQSRWPPPECSEAPRQPTARAASHLHLFTTYYLLPERDNTKLPGTHIQSRIPHWISHRRFARVFQAKKKTAGGWAASALTPHT